MGEHSEEMKLAADRFFELVPTLSGMLDIHGYPTFSRYDDPVRLADDAANPEGSDPFYVLVNAIANQQLSSKAANTILGRLRSACGGVVSRDRIIALGFDGIRPMGFSGQKALALVSLANSAKNGDLKLDDLDHMADDEIIDMISSQRGLGRWSAEMFLMFHLGRMDVWPVDDLGVRKGHAKLMGLEEPLKPKQLMVEGERFRPYRSIAAWYCWAAID